MVMTRSDILDLSKLGEGEQYLLLAPLFQTRTEEEICPRCDRDLVFAREESLPDLTDRLFGSGKGIRVSHMVEIYMAQTGNTAPDKDIEYSLFWRWWAMEALPIHRIQAALLAKESPK